MKNKTLSPLFLQSTLDFGAYSNTPVQRSATPLDIVNPNRSAMLIDQIRFSTAALHAERSVGSFYNEDLLNFTVEVLLGSIPVTKRFVTLGALCPRYLRAPASGPGLPFNNQFATDQTLVWHLPRPLYVPSNVQLSINMNRLGLFDEGVSKIDVAVVGRSLPTDFPVPGSIDIPFVTEFRVENSTNNPPPAAADLPYRAVSADSDLANANDVPLFVEKLVGVNYAEQEAGDSQGPTQDANFTVQMSLSNGTLLIRDPIPFFVAFPSDRGILPISAKLQPGEFIRCELEAGDPAADQYSNGVATTAIALHGYRKVQTPGTIG